MKYSFEATVNYPETTVDTPKFDNVKDVYALSILMQKLISEEKDATSFLITIVPNAL